MSGSISTTPDPNNSDPPWNSLTAMLADSFSRYAGREAVVDGEVRLTYDEIATRVQALAAALASRGFAPGDSLVIWAPNCWQWIVSAMACWWLGGILVPVSARLKGLDVVPVLESTGARFLFFGSAASGVDPVELLREYLAQDGRELEGALPDLSTLVDLDGGSRASGPAVLEWGDFCRQGEGRTAAPAAVSPDEICEIVFTSGTTGRPKGVMRCHGPTVRGSWVQVTMQKFTAEDRSLVVSPYSHIAGLAAMLRCAIAGSAHVVVRQYQPASALRQIEKEGVTVMGGPPSLFAQLLAEDTTGRVLSRLRHVGSGAAQISPQLIYDLLSRGVGVVNAAYGMTECALISSTSLGDSVEVVANTVGKPTPGIQIKLVDQDGNCMTQGERGEILAKGYATMAGYYKDEEKTREILSPDGWLRTGDVGRLTPEGNLQIVGRVKDMIIVHGYNVYPVEVESQLMSSGLLEEVAVVGQPSPLSGEECVAFIVPRGNPETARRDLLAWARKYMAEYRVPSRVIIRSSLPLTINRKLDREALRRELGKR
jgi:acyl-CoA synthetase (AMP-forming)/AMP-acid ligase II